MIYGIVARNQDGYIGTLDNKLPWRIPEDLRFFKDKTLGNKVIMGRKTFESIGKPLKDRENIVVSKQKDLHIDGVVVLNTIEECVDTRSIEDLFIIGGAEIYKAFRDYIDIFYVTEVEFDMTNGVKIDLDGFTCIECEDWKVSKTGIRYRFCKYSKV